MKTLVVTSLISAAVSLLAILALSAMTIAPGAGAGVSRTRMMFLAGAFLLAWLDVALWAQRRGRADRQGPPAQWLGRVLVAVGVVYVCSVCMVILG